MASNLLTTSDTIMCPHGGTAVLFTSNVRVTAGGSPVLLTSDIYPVAGCPFTIGTKPSPCIRIEWSTGAIRSTVNGTAVSFQSGVGLCYSPEGAVQGTAIIINSQIKVSSE
jgi:hypothetical protein